MPLNKPEQTRASGEGYYTSSVFTAAGLLDSIAEAIEHEFGLESFRPSTYYDTRIFKVTVTVEEV